MERSPATRILSLIRPLALVPALLLSGTVHAGEAGLLASQASEGDWSSLLGFGLALLGITGLILIRRQSSLL